MLRSVALLLLAAAAAADVVNVHLVPHSHDDAGWLKTVDEYYAGTRMDIDSGAVVMTLDTVIESLRQNSNRTFVECEMAFFSRWWRQQDDDTRGAVRNLMASKQLTFVGGGWTQCDEANVYYQEVIDEMTLGHSFILDNIGASALPKVAWQIDPFGHTNGVARLFAEMDLEAVFFARIDFQDKSRRRTQKELEFIWKPSTSLVDTSIFAGAFVGHYDFCLTFDQRSRDDNIQDDPSLTGFNMDDIIAKFVNGVLDESRFSKDSNVMLKLGDDFTHMNAHRNFRNIDKIIAYVNARPEQYQMNIFYSSPEKYVAAKLADDTREWPTVTSDFVPYADGDDAYWTGYFTSRSCWLRCCNNETCDRPRPVLKFAARACNAVLQACQQVYAISPSTLKSSPVALAQAVALVQVSLLSSCTPTHVLQTYLNVKHHDAIAGTSRQAVADDYMRRLKDGVLECVSVILPSSDKSDFVLIPQTDSIIAPTAALNLVDGSTVEVHVYNSLAQANRPDGSYARIPLTSPNVKIVRRDRDVDVAQQIIENDAGDATPFTLVFNASPMPPLGFSVFAVVPSSKVSVLRIEENRSPTMVMANKWTRVLFSVKTGLLMQVDSIGDVQIPVRQEFGFYRSYEGEGQKSGAYIFRPDGEFNTLLVSVPTLRRVGTPADIVQEIHQVFDEEHITQIVRLYRDQRGVELEYHIGPIDGGREYIMRLRTAMKTDGEFFTDSNGLEMQKRVLNQRPTWHLNLHEPIAGNYYPVNTITYIRDKAENVQLTLLTDRSMGAASLADGELELMIHRRLNQDDGRGVSEPLNEPGLVVIGRMTLLVSTIDKAASRYRPAALAMAHPMLSFLSDVLNDHVSEAAPAPPTSHSVALSTPLPRNVHLLSLQARYNGFIVRVHHFFELGEDDLLSRPATINIAKLFTFAVHSCTETILTATKSLSTQPDSCDNITLSPMQIRTFLINTIVSA